MDKAAMPEGKYLASVKLGPKGRSWCLRRCGRCSASGPGTRCWLADVNGGIALQTFEKADPVFRDVLFGPGAIKVPRLQARHFYFILTFCLCGAISKKSITNKKKGA